MKNRGWNSLLFQKVKNGVWTSILLLPKANGPSTRPLYLLFIISNSEILSNDELVPNLWILLPILNDFMNVLQLGMRWETKVQTSVKLGSPLYITLLSLNSWVFLLMLANFSTKNPKFFSFGVLSKSPLETQKFHNYFSFSCQNSQGWYPHENVKVWPHN